MGTPFTDIYGSFVQKISDYSFVNLTDEEMDEYLNDLLKAAIPRFKKCVKNLNDNNDIQFNETLTREEIEIVSLLMVIEWLRPRINNIELLKQSFNTKDWNTYSQANHLKELSTLKDETQLEVDNLIISYTYSSGKLEDLK